MDGENENYIEDGRKRGRKKYTELKGRQSYPLAQVEGVAGVYRAEPSGPAGRRACGSGYSSPQH